ncbi:DUF6417 family protein [Streptomyces sp. NBC_01538]|uniref:DUF6417 family protein n=1 Tax=Streptomyces sp. NBC_01538 TaxID=2903897 RepID=UPI003864262B
MLNALCQHEADAQEGWALDDAVPGPVQQHSEGAAREGLVELADKETRAELSVLASRPVRWAARLTPYGRDTLTYAHARPPDVPDGPQPGPGERLVELRPAQMGAVRVFVSLANALATAPVEGLAERVHTASFSREDNRWRLSLNDTQIASVAYGLYLHRLTGSEAAANRFARDYGVAYRPSPHDGTPALVVLGQHKDRSDGA